MTRPSMRSMPSSISAETQSSTPGKPRESMLGSPLPATSRSPWSVPATIGPVAHTVVSNR